MSSARGRKAWGECGRCGARVLANTLVNDGYVFDLLVERRCWEPPYPLDTLPPLDDPIAIDRPSPSNNRSNIEVRFPNYDVVNNTVNSPLNMNMNFGEAIISTVDMVESLWMTSDSDWMTDDGGNKLIFNG